MEHNENSESKRDKLEKALSLALLYINGGEEHSEYRAKPRPKHRNSRDWHCKETFMSLNSWIGLDYGILNRLEEEGLLTQPQKGKRRVTYVSLTKQGMKRAREILGEIINLEGVEETLEARSYHEEYINYEWSWSEQEYPDLENSGEE